MIQNDLLAADLALLLPEPVAERVHALNAAMLARGPNDSDVLRLDATHLPHITLLQMFVRRANLPGLIDRIDPIMNPILRGSQPLTLRVTGVGSSTVAAHFAIEPSSSLQELHEALADAVQPYEESSGGPDAFYTDGETPRDGDIAWVTHFRANSSYGNFSPHITLGVGPPPEFREPFEFTAGLAALCHLGRFCTCRVVLREWVRELPQKG